MSKGNFKRALRHRAQRDRDLDFSDLLSVPASHQPTDEQLARFMVAAIGRIADDWGLAVALTELRSDPRVREDWRRAHYDFQRGLQ